MPSSRKKGLYVKSAERQLELTPLRVAQALEYYPRAGVFLWKVRPLEHFVTKGVMKAMNNKLAGGVAGTVWSDGSGNKYWVIGIFNTHVQGGPLAIYMTTGVMPVAVKYKDGNGLNLRLTNLEVSDIAGVLETARAASYKTRARNAI